MNREAGGVDSAEVLLDGGGAGWIDGDGLELGVEGGDEGVQEAEGVVELECRGMADAEGVCCGDGGEMGGEVGGGDEEGEGLDGGVEGLGELGEGVGAGVEGLEDEGVLGRGGGEEGGSHSGNVRCLRGGVKPILKQ